MIDADKYYKKQLSQILKEMNKDVDPRPVWEDGTPAHSYFITQISQKYNIARKNFPIPTLRNTSIKMGIKEIFWIYQLQSNKLSDARELGINWWDEWDIGDGTIGQRYGATIKRYGMMDRVLNDLETNPFSRRININMLQENDLRETMGLHPCAFMTLWSVRPTKNPNKRFLDLTLVQRSNDYITAGAINQIQYVSFGLMVVGHLNHYHKSIKSKIRYQFGNFKHDVQNLHIYDRHIDAAHEILNREPIEDFKFNMYLKEDKNFYDYTIDDFVIESSHKISKINSPLPIAV